VKPLLPPHLVHRFTQEVQLPWDTDGMIFTHQNLRLTPFRVCRHLVFKWKPPHEHTVDFLVDPDRKQAAAPPCPPCDLPQDVVARYRTFPLAARGERVVSLRVPARTQRPQDSSSWWFCDALVPEDLTLPGAESVHECRWSEERAAWLHVRVRHKRANQWETVWRTLGNLDEKLELEEVAEACGRRQS